ncbi:MAG: SDR family oxidoreductase [Pseudomonadota bacterium]
MSLDGHRVVITAGGDGIGAAMARGFAAAGARVALCDIDRAAAESVAADLPAALGLWGDVADEASVDAFFDAAETHLGGIDVLCANAGTGGPVAPLTEISLEDWRACLAVNLDGSFLACRRAAPVMQAQGAGAIVMTSSTSGLYGVPTRSPYVAAKWAVIGVMKTLAMELGPSGVRVNAICPGAVEGARMDRVVAAEAAARGRTEAEVRALYAEGTSMRRWVTAEEVADTAVFLASPQARHISGQAIAVDGHTERMT